MKPPSRVAVWCKSRPIINQFSTILPERCDLKREASHD